MNRCPNCAAQNREGAKFCTSCGFRLPQEAPAPVGSERSPFATTSSVTNSPASSAPPEPSGFETWNTETTAAQNPGTSWDAEPLPNRAVPVDDDMIASLVGPGESDEPATASEPETAPSTSDWTAALTAAPAQTDPTSVDHLLKLARELEHGLIELAGSPSAAGESVATGSLRGVLDSLQSEDDLAPLRTAVETAQQRPRDVDVMLDLVLRADAIAGVLHERDLLKEAIEQSLSGAGDERSAEREAEFAGERPVEGEPADISERFTEPGQNDEDQIAI